MIVLVLEQDNGALLVMTPADKKFEQVLRSLGIKQRLRVTTVNLGN